jgi:cellulose synthase/poly-beta-1,6-N-acetylglucosamine synthase-like glycosyltransferase
LAVDAMSALRDLMTVLFGLAVTVPAAYLAFLAAVTLFARPIRRVPADPSGALRLAILVPAHDEELLIGRTVDGLQQLRYPRDRFSVHVVADNCTDRTAAVARQHGATVHERTDPARRGKGAALNWLIDQLAGEAPDIDGFVIVDADSALSPDFLSAMDEHLRAGDQIVQALNLVAVAEDRPLIHVRELALELTCHLRPLAYTTLGGSSLLCGNGMCFSAAVLRRYRWSETSVVEDGELYIRLLRDGRRVTLATDAVVRSVMPATWREARSQSVRWDRARFDHAPEAAAFIWDGLRRGDRTAFLAGLSIIHPSVTVLLAAAVAGLVAGAVAGAAGLVDLAAIAIVAVAFYTLRGASLGGMKSRVLLRLLLWAPLYAGWKLSVMGRAALGAGRKEWARTSRAE